jgi:hypothetical protein
VRTTQLTGSGCQQSYLLRNRTNRAGAELDFQDERGWTALMKGCKSGSAEVVLELLHAGADATRINSDGRTAMDWAEAYGRADIQELIGLAGQGALPVKARAACVDPQLTAEGNSSAPAAAHAHGSASCSGLDSEARRSPPPRTAGDVGVDERRPAAVDPAAGQRSLAHELRQLRQRVRGLEGGDSGSSDRSSPAAVPQLRDHHQLATVVDSSSVGSPADRLSGWRSAPRYVGELSTRLKHVEQQLSAQAQHWETELRGMAGQIEVRDILPRAFPARASVTLSRRFPDRRCRSSSSSRCNVVRVTAKPSGRERCWRGWRRRRKW